MLTSMELERLFDELVDLAERLGIGVRVEILRPGPSDHRSQRGGLCRVGARRIILIDERGRLPDRIATLASALNEAQVDFGSLHPVVAATLGAHARVGGGQKAPRGDHRPLAKGRPTSARKRSPSDPDI